jgi:hypothetical protein
MRGKAKLLVLALGMLLAVPAIALADVVQNDVEATAGQKIVSVQAGQTSSDIGYRINDTGGDTTDPIPDTGQNCNPEVKAAELTLSGLPSGVAVKDTSGNALTAPHLTFTSCDTFKYVKLAVGGSVAAGDYTIKVADITNDGYVSGDFNENPATFTLRVTGGGGGGGGTCTNPAAPTTIDSTPASAGPSGWFTTAPTVSASSTTAGATIQYATDVNGGGKSAFSSTVPALGEGTTVVYAKAVSGTCSSGEASRTFMVDTRFPSIADGGATSSPTGTDGNGDEWYNHAVTNLFEAEDPVPGSGFASPNANPYDISVSSDDSNPSNDPDEGRGITLASGPVSDVAGNTTQSVDSAPFNIDLTDPLLNISGAAGGTSDVCSIPSRPSFAPSDALSGLDGSEGDSWSTPPPENGGIGAYTYSAHAKDYATNTSSETRTYTVVPDLNYTDTAGPFSGILQPVNLTGTRSSFKLGSTIPIKFRVMCGATPVTGLKVSLWLSRVDGTADPVNEAVATTTGTTGTLFRYDATSGQYIFNLATKGDYVDPAGNTLAMGQGTWYLSLLFAGTNQKVQVGSIDLKK